MKKEMNYIDSVHSFGRKWNIFVMIMLIAYPVATGLIFRTGPDWHGFALGLVATAPMYWAVAVVETITYVPMLGAGGSYLSFVTGNISNLKLPVALNALEQADVKASSEEGEVISTIAIAVSSIVTTIIIIIGVILIRPLTPVLNAPVLAPAFAQMIPALFGALGVVFISKNVKIAVIPVIVMLILFIAVPALNSGTVGIMVPVGVLFTLGVSRLMYKKGLLEEAEMIGWIILAILVILIAVILIRTAAFKPAPAPEESFDDVSFDKDRAVRNLSELVKCRTVSFDDHSKEDDAEFEKLIALLPSLYPNVFKTCEFIRLADRGILFRWPGISDGKADPAVFMAHYDVVPVEEKNWEKDPFCGEVEGGVMWGRGTLDTKVTFNGALLAADTLIAQGFKPKDDIYLAFSGQEEINGTGAVRIVDWFAERGITPSMVVDEGGAVVEGVFPGVSGACALIGIAEKGLMNVDFVLETDGGHASAPAPHTPVGRLSKACVDIESSPLKSHFTEPVLKMFDTLGRHSTFVYRMIFANLWCFRPVLDMICKKSGGELNALVRTTTAFTQMSGSKANNVIPPSASMTANVRINPAETSADVIAHYRSVIKDPDIKVEASVEAEPSRISRTDCEGWERVCRAIRGTWKGCLVSPYLMVQCSDSRHYGKISDKVFRFSAMDLTAEERRMIHGNNERIRLECLSRAVEFYIRLESQC